MAVGAIGYRMPSFKCNKGEEPENEERQSHIKAHAEGRHKVSIVGGRRKASSFAEGQQSAEGAPLMRRTFWGQF